MNNPAISTAVNAVVDELVASAVANSTAATGWYAINAKKENDEAEISIYDAIGSWGIGAERFVSDLKSISAKTINLRLNTPGGEVFDATAIYNAIKEHPARVVVHVDGLAASAGSFIAMSGDEVRMADNSYMMIHNARGGVMGEATDMRRYAETLEKMNDNIAGIYEKKTGKSKDHWKGLMDAETWFTAAEAKAEGLADVVYAAEKKQPGKARAAFDGKAWNKLDKVPDAIRESWGITKPATAPEPAQRSAATPELQTSQKENAIMADNATSQTVAPAQTPAAGPSVSQGNTVAELNQAAINSYIDKGRALGFQEGMKAEQDRMREILTAAPNRPDIAVNAFLAGQNAATVSLIANAAAQAEAKAQEVQMKKDIEIARLNALVATGGHTGVNLAPSNPANFNNVPEGLDPEDQAAMEWDSNPIIRSQNGGESGKKRWMLYRVNQLKGSVRVLKTA